MPTHAATRKNGICKGSLYKQHLSVAIPPSMNSFNTKYFNEINERRSKTHDYCALIGNTLSSYPNINSYYRGDFPISEVRIVGASAWNPSPPSSSLKLTLRRNIGGVGTSSGKNDGNTSNSSSNGSSNSGSSSFRIVTYAGTHIYCSAPSSADRDTWLAALHSGLEASYALYHETLIPSRSKSSSDEIELNQKMDSAEPQLHKSSTPTQQILNPPPKHIELQTYPSIPAPSSASSSSSAAVNAKYCISCGKPARTFSASSTLSSSQDDRSFAPFYTASTPLPQYGIECRADVCQSCLFSQGILSHVTCLVGLYEGQAHERAALQAAQSMALRTVEKAIREEQERLLEEEDEKKTQQDCTEEGDLVDNMIADANHHHKVLSGGSSDLGGSWATISSTENGNSSPSKSSTLNQNTTTSHSDPVTNEHDANPNSTSNVQANQTNNHQHQNISSTSSTWLHLPPTDAATKALLSLIQTPGFATFRRRARALEVQCRRLEHGTIGGAAEFLELLADYAPSNNHLFPNQYDDTHEKDIQNSVSELKKEAFKVAGDMSAAIKLLADHALPSARVGDASEFLMANEMLATIFEFLLDLCEDGELGAVAFFWPQLKHLHLRMLPARDADALVRVELMEDFLLTVCARYSVHLGLELVWGLIADLEESMQDPTASPMCRARRFSVLRFVCELESTLFGFDGGWGGGRVSLKGMLSPSEHQASLTRDAIGILQLHRRYSGHYLSRSVRIERLNEEAKRDFGINEDETKINCVPPSSTESIAEIRANANFFSSQLEYARRLGDIAEKLRFMDVEKRSAALEKELELLNVGKMGGDPISRAGDKISSVVRLPSKEGHVFRSKERTPLLLLMEVLRPETLGVGTDEMASDEQKIEETHEEGTDSPISPPPPPPSLSMDVESAQEQIDEKMDANPPSKPHKRPSVDRPGTPKARALKRIGSDLVDESCPAKRKSASDKEMEEMVAEAVKHQLHLHDSSLVEQENQTEKQENVQSNQSSTSNSPREKREIRSTSPVPSSSKQKKMSALGTFGISAYEAHNGHSSSLSVFGEGRREVLTTILARGMRGDSVAKGATKAVQRTVQVMDRERAVKLIMDSGNKKLDSKNTMPKINSSDDLKSRSGSMHGDDSNATTDENEAIEALRLLLIQNRVAQGNCSPTKSASDKDLAAATGSDNDETDDMLGKGVVDAGEVDPRLLGCGPMSAAMVNAMKMWKDGVVSNGEVLELVQKDLQFSRHAELTEAEMATKLVEDSAFWVRFAFGERWAEKKARIAAKSPFGAKPGWDLVGVIVKSNDDLRQEAFVMQLIELCQEAFENAGLELWVQPYRILATSRTTGIIETVRNAISFDGLKKRPGYGNGGLRGHLIRMTEFEPDPKAAFENAQRNFVRSLAAYSLMSYLFMFKDRHNGNLLLDTAGHVIHIDFGFVFGIAPGGSFSLEMSTPFKLTEEMLEVMDGPASPLFSEFVTLFCCGFLALQNHVDTFCTVVQITCKGSNFKCFEGKDSSELLEKMRARFAPDLDKTATVAFALDLINQATSSYGTKQYDFFQYLSQGIAA